MPKIIFDFKTKEAMQLWKNVNMWDVEPEPSPFGNIPDERELEMHKEIDDNLTITEED